MRKDRMQFLRGTSMGDQLSLTSECLLQIAAQALEQDKALNSIVFLSIMVGQNTYVPPRYIPLELSDAEAEADVPPADVIPTPQHINSVPGQWSSGICACFDDMQSCCVGIFCPCYLFGRNAEALGSGTMMGSCMMHFILWALVNTVCCVLTEGVMLGLPGCFVACYACGYRRTLRANYNLEEAPCGDFVTHFFCHLCAMCQEYREIRERSQDLNSTSRNMVEVAAPPVQKMEPASPK